jgi:hypothetical protein
VVDLYYSSPLPRLSFSPLPCARISYMWPVRSRIPDTKGLQLSHMNMGEWEMENSPRNEL